MQPLREVWLLRATSCVAALAFAGLAANSVVAAGSISSGGATELAGPVRVLDGDTIVIGATHIRLEGIDAPESAQTCTDAQGATWACGKVATALMVRLTTGREAQCFSHGLDLYGRTLATCMVDGLDISREMVRQGLAWAFVKYASTYVAEEAAARAAGLGIWQATNQPAWEWRAARWKQSAQAEPATCPIKGNISRHGHIYHMPWDPWYQRTTIDERRGERWFCSEAEAQAAGWRHAMAR